MDLFKLYLPAPMLKALRASAKRLDVSVAELIRRAIDNYLKGTP